jgi:hypothetical protein
MKVWILTSEHNDYSQYGEVFEGVFTKKPTSEHIQKACGVTEYGAAHILAGGGRQQYEDRWYMLKEYDA